MRGYSVDAKKELDAQWKKLENSALGVRTALLSFDSIFDELLEEGKKNNKKPETIQSNDQLQQPRSPGNSPRK